jgi:nitrite reductase (NADH) small subunit
VACPLHNQVIGLADGCARAPDSGCTPTFAVQLQGTQVLLNVQELRERAVDTAVS